MNMKFNSYLELILKKCKYKTCVLLFYANKGHKENDYSTFLLIFFLFFITFCQFQLVLTDDNTVLRLKTGDSEKTEVEKPTHREETQCSNLIKINYCVYPCFFPISSNVVLNILVDLTQKVHSSRLDRGVVSCRSYCISPQCTKVHNLFLLNSSEVFSQSFIQDSCYHKTSTTSPFFMLSGNFLKKFKK